MDVMVTFTVHFPQLPHPLEVCHLSYGMVALVKGKASVEAIGIDELLQLLSLAP